MKKVFRAYWPTIRRHGLLLICTILAMIAGIGLTALAPYYVRDIVNTFTSQKPDIGLVKELFWKLFWVYVALDVVYRIFDWCVVLYESRGMRDLDQRSFAVLQSQSIRFFENAFAGSLVKYMTRFRSSFEAITDIVCFELGRDAIMFVVATVVFFQSQATLAWAFIVWSTIFLSFSTWAAHRKYPIDKVNADADSAVGGALADSISNHFTVKTFGQEGEEQKRFNGTVNYSYQKRLYSWQTSNVIGAIQWTMVIGAELGLIAWMIHGWEKGYINAGDFVFFQTYITWILGHFQSFGQHTRRLMSYLADAEEMATIYANKPEIQDSPGSRPLVIEEGCIDFHAVSFKYTATDQNYTLNNFDLQIPAGQSVGLVGKTGAGKSTVIKILLHLYELNSGYIRIDRQDISNVTQASLRQQIALVPQQPQLFHRSIRENIAFGSINAREEDIIRAAKKAGAWEFIQKLPKSLDEVVGERGVKLSGGEAQRIIIARAILADCRVLVFDEATSALDSETEKYIQGSTKVAMQGRTSLVIAHRLSTLMNLDRIIVIQDGRIIEDGDHRELLAKNGHYANLWKHQVGGYIS